MRVVVVLSTLYIILITDFIEVMVTVLKVVNVVVIVLVEVTIITTDFVSVSTNLPIPNSTVYNFLPILTKRVVKVFSSLFTMGSCILNVVVTVRLYLGNTNVVVVNSGSEMGKVSVGFMMR